MYNSVLINVILCCIISNLTIYSFAQIDINISVTSLLVRLHANGAKVYNNNENALQNQLYNFYYITAKRNKIFLLFTIAVKYDVH